MSMLRAPLCARQGLDNKDEYDGEYKPGHDGTGNGIQWIHCNAPDVGLSMWKFIKIRLMRTVYCCAGHLSSRIVPDTDNAVNPAFTANRLPVYSKPYHFTQVLTPR